MYEHEEQLALYNPIDCTHDTTHRYTRTSAGASVIVESEMQASMEAEFARANMYFDLGEERTSGVWVPLEGAQ